MGIYNKDLAAAGWRFAYVEGEKTVAIHAEMPDGDDLYSALMEGWSLHAIFDEEPPSTA